MTTKTKKIEEVKSLLVRKKKQATSFELWHLHTKDEQKFLTYIEKKIFTGTKKKLGQGNISLEEFKAVITEEDCKQLRTIFDRVKYHDQKAKN
jgi:hypothetical protein